MVGIMNGRVLFYDDAAVFGGHEKMTLNALQSMAHSGDFEIGFVYSRKNVSLESRLRELAHRYSCIELLPLGYVSGSLQFLKTPFAIDACRDLRATMRSFRPDCVVVVQGEISLSSLGLWAARRERIPAISYIPLARSRRERGEGRLAWLKDLLLRPYYRLPDAYITIGESVAATLRARSVNQPIRVVENGIDPEALRVMPKGEARKQLGLPLDTYLAGLVGRIECKVKGHDLLLRAVAEHRDQFRGWTFLLVGDGPDKAAMTVMAEKLKLGALVQFVPWQNDLATLYSALDMVVMPSRFEGVPVVMLEAMHYRLPVVASNLDAMKELLPSDWLFTAANPSELAARLLEVRHSDQNQLLDRNRRIIEERFTRQKQGAEFCAAMRWALNLAANRGASKLTSPTT
jgi:glycosyltransferase involved in cell wall biosynthesis